MRLLQEVHRRLGYAGSVEYWLHLELPERADEQQLREWQALPEPERLRVTEQFDRICEDTKREIAQEWLRCQRVKNGIRSGSVMLTFFGVLGLCLTIGTASPWPDAGSESFLSFWWLVSLAVLAGLYGSGCKLGERWFDLRDSQEFGLRP
jgi:hypothetical protein